MSTNKTNSMNDPMDLYQAILEKLSQVIDPETGVDVVRMHLIEDLTVDASGRVKYKFRPSSPLCPIAIPLLMAIQEAISQVVGVTDQQVEIVGFVQKDELMEWLNQAISELGVDKEE